MPLHRIPMHPLDPLGMRLSMENVMGAAIGFSNVSTDEKRYIAEHEAVSISESSTLGKCAYTLSLMALAHLSQLNVILGDSRTIPQYSGPVDMLAGEAERSSHKEIHYTGNIADVRKHLAELDFEINKEHQRARFLKAMFWRLLFGFVFLAMAVYSCFTGAAVDVLSALIHSTWFIAVLTIAAVVLSLFFGYAAIAVPIAVALVALGWFVLKWPVVTTILVNGLLFLIAGKLLLKAIGKLKDAIKSAPLSDEERRLKPVRIAEREALCRELAEYSNLMLTGLRMIKEKYRSDEEAFYKATQKYLGTQYPISALDEVFSFLERYYRGVKWESSL